MMFKDLFSSGDILTLPVVVMLAFMLVFLGVTAWVFSKRRHEKYETASRLPLDEFGEDSSR